jgi:hypothetical protein
MSEAFRIQVSEKNFSCRSRIRWTAFTDACRGLQPRPFCRCQKDDFEVIQHSQSGSVARLISKRANKSRAFTEERFLG